jgi:thiosulfate dehydrogenase
MARSAKSSSRSRGGSSVGPLLLGILVGWVLAAIGIGLYFRFGSPPVAVTDRAALWEPLLDASVEPRAQAEAKQPPFPEGEDAFEGAAHSYRASCAQCHGTPGHDATQGHTMLPHAPQFFSLSDRKKTSAQSPGELYWKTAFGIRHSGMPAYNKSLTDTQLWQLALLLHAANDELPDPVRSILTAGTPPPQPTVVKP